jgi:hypothetical protein
MRDDDYETDDWWCSTTFLIVVSALLVAVILWAFRVWWQYRAAIQKGTLSHDVCHNWQRWRMFSYLLFLAIGITIPRCALFGHLWFTILAVGAFFVFFTVSFTCLPYYMYAFRTPSKRFFPDLDAPPTISWDKDVPAKTLTGIML